MLLFKYPQMKRALLNYKEDITNEQAEAREEDPEAEVMDEDEIEALAYNRLMEQGVGTNELSECVCQDYTDEEIRNDTTAIDYDHAIEEVERVEEHRKQQQLELIKDQERQRLEQEFMLLQRADKEKEEKLI